MNTLGVDTDADGGVVLLDPRGSMLGSWSVPTRNGRWHDGDAAQLVREVGDPGVAFVEAPQVIWVRDRRGRMGQSAGSSMRLGYSAGRLVQLFTDAGWEVHEVNVDTWHKAMGIKHRSRRDTKGQSLRLARLHLPTLDLQPGRRTTDQHGVADAALIALYGHKLRRLAA